MEQTVNTRANGFSRWWRSDSAGIVRFGFLFAVFFFGYVIWMSAKINGLLCETKDFYRTENLYAPAMITAPEFDSRELAVSDATSREEFARNDRLCKLHFVKIVNTSTAGFPEYEIQYIAKPGDNSTHVYKYREAIEAKPLSFWVQIVPEYFIVKDGSAMVYWHYESRNKLKMLAISLIVSAAIALTLAILWDKRIEKH